MKGYKGNQEGTGEAVMEKRLLQREPMSNLFLEASDCKSCSLEVTLG